MSAIKRIVIEFNNFIEDESCSFYGVLDAIIATINKLFPELR